MSDAVPPLARPPIFEVACGVEFESIREIDPVLLGGFWLKVRDQFPLRETHDEIVRPRPGVHLVFGDHQPLRTWFVSKDGEFVVQIQRDRFFLNWRSLGVEGRYPRFSSSPEGVLHRSVALFERLSAFLEEAVGSAPRPLRVEVLKVDQFVEGRDWRGYDDLMVMMPMLRQFQTIGPFRKPLPAFRLVEQLDGTSAEVALETLPVSPKSRHVRVSTTIRAPITPGGSFAQAAAAAGRVANSVFAALVPRDEMLKRFGDVRTEGA